MFGGTQLEFSQELIYLGPIYIISSRRGHDLLHRANYNIIILCTFSNFADPFVQSMLIKSFCLSLYGGQLWNLCNKKLISSTNCF